MEPVSQMVLPCHLAGNFTLMNFLSDSFMNHSIYATYIYAVMLLDKCCKNNELEEKGENPLNKQGFQNQF